MTRSIPKNIAFAALAAIMLGLLSSPAAAENCEGFTTMTVKLVIAGEPKDGFRIIGKCGDTEVARCRAVIKQGEKRAKCEETAVIEGLSGRVRCIVGPKNGNSAKATEKASSCFVQ